MNKVPVPTGDYTTWTEDQEELYEDYHSFMFAWKRGDTLLHGCNPDFGDEIKAKILAPVADPSAEHAELFNTIAKRHDKFLITGLGQMFAAFVIDRLKKDHPDWLANPEFLVWCLNTYEYGDEEDD